jgi:D-alanyl-lipoteichoic acid acyltransferase DltB (MBOAT superfamily)
VASLVTNLGILFSFKYYDFAVDSLQTVFAPWSLFRHLPELEVLLPVGISFYTFQSLGYTIEVYRGNRRAERHLGIFALYVAFSRSWWPGPSKGPTACFRNFGGSIDSKPIGWCGG